MRAIITPMLGLFLCLQAAAGEAQTRTRKIAEFTSGRARVTVNATGNTEGTFAAVELIGTDVVEFVRVVLYPEEAIRWADTASALVARTLTPAAGETLEEWAGSGQTRSADIDLIRRTTRSGTTYDVFLSDEHVVNTVHLTASAQRAREVIAAVRQAAAAASAMLSAPPKPSASNPATRDSIPPGSTWIGDPATFAAFALECVSGQKTRDRFRQLRETPVYFETRQAAQAAGYTIVDRPCGALAK